MKLISWNVNGIRACTGKGFMDFFKNIDADIFGIQESKMQEGQLKLDLPGYHQYWNYAKRKGYSGTAVFTKVEPISVKYGIDRNSKNIKSTIKLYGLEEKLPEVDAVIITISHDFDNIRNIIIKKYDYEIVSLFDIFG